MRHDGVSHVKGANDLAHETQKPPTHFRVSGFNQLFNLVFAFPAAEEQEAHCSGQ